LQGGFPEVTRVLRGSHFWSASYFAASCGGAPIETLRRYVESHTFAGHLVMRGAQLKAVQELLGHSTIEMTMRYAHLTPDVRRDANGGGSLAELVRSVWETMARTAAWEAGHG
jgi:integrase